MLRRFGKTLMALGFGQGIHLLGQWLLPPLFVLSYGVEGLAHWLLLTAAASHLTALDFGLQTYLVNELTFLHQRGELRRFREVQSVGMWLSLGLVGLGLLVTGSLWLLPWARWLGVGSMARGEITMGLLAVQVTAGLILGQWNGLFRIAGEPQRGVGWYNVARLGSLVTTVGLAAAKAPFWVIAAGQTLSVLLVLALVIGTLRRDYPELFPRWHYWNGRDAREITRGSLYFGLFALNQLLVFQLPLILLSRWTEPATVVVYSVGRTLFSLVRQMANMIMAALAPELTRLRAQGNQIGLGQVFRNTEALVYSTGLCGGVALYLAAPWLLEQWLGQRGMYDPTVYLWMMLASVGLLIKECKLYFQYATNEHRRTGLITSITYALLLVVSGPIIGRWGLVGWLMAWTLAEAVQTAGLHLENVRLLANETTVFGPLARLAGVTAIAALAAWQSEPIVHQAPGWLGFFRGLIVLAGLAGVCAGAWSLGSPVREAWRRWFPGRSNEARAASISTLL